jgi:hypothetical protein
MFIGLFKTDKISVQSSRILSPSSNVTGTATKHPVQKSFFFENPIYLATL